ncbi:MAG TPA: type II toxin-antitoxin system HicA family toxin [Gammaproteobacteria bacterium]|nr:type II toxin-antitoxin system HicA family toxin [Gammaproteobacteria bacterium]
MQVGLACNRDARLTNGQNCPILGAYLRGNEFIRLVRACAKAHGEKCEWHPDLGKGSHGVLMLGDRRTVVRCTKDELKAGTLHAMLRQLGLSEKDM